MDLLKVAFTPSQYDSNSYEYDFSVTIQSDEINQLFLFGVDLWDADGFNSGSPQNFSPFVNPNMPNEGEKDEFKNSWVVSANIFSGNGKQVSGFKSVAVSGNKVLPSINWFAYVITNGTLVSRLEGSALNTSAPNPPINPRLT